MKGLGLYLVGPCFFVAQVSAQVYDAPARQYAGAEVVFTGHLQKIKPSYTGFDATFQVDQLIKGRVTDRKNLRVELPRESPCHKVEERHAYLVYARSISQDLSVEPCDGIKLLSQAEADLRYIHSLDPRVSEKCNEKELAQLATKSPIVATAEVIGTEDSLGTSSTAALVRQWCGFSLTTEDAFYKVREVLKGRLPDSPIIVEHWICWDTVTAPGYAPGLSDDLFKKGNVLLLFLKSGSFFPARQPPPPFTSVYQDVDDDCGAVMADGEAAMKVAGSLSKTDPTTQ